MVGGSDPVWRFLLELVASAVGAGVGCACSVASLTGACGDRGALVGGVTKAGQLIACKRLRATARRVATSSSSLLSSHTALLVPPVGCVPCCSAGTDISSSLLSSQTALLVVLVGCVPCCSAVNDISSSLSLQTALLVVPVGCAPCCSAGTDISSSLLSSQTALLVVPVGCRPCGAGPSSLLPAPCSTGTGAAGCVPCFSTGAEISSQLLSSQAALLVPPVGCGL